ncbi:MAG: hypothetical protein HRT90_04915 [Candidatus Margulisbacteria bacterium]|nr:hypothetical protein [Candidatus Margulisiibacteriota bacterium]
MIRIVWNSLLIDSKKELWLITLNKLGIKSSFTVVAGKRVWKTDYYLNRNANIYIIEELLKALSQGEIILYDACPYGEEKIASIKESLKCLPEGVTYKMGDNTNTSTDKNNISQEADLLFDDINRIYKKGLKLNLDSTCHVVTNSGNIKFSNITIGSDPIKQDFVLDIDYAMEVPTVQEFASYLYLHIGKILRNTISTK